MPKKARSARRDARKLEAELIAARERISQLEADKRGLVVQLDASRSLAARLSQSEMRTRWRRDEQSFVVSVMVSEGMLRECRVYPGEMAEMLGYRLVKEIEAV